MELAAQQLSTQRYDYEELDRLVTSTNAPWGNITYTYDEVGNRKTMVENGTITTNYTYGSYNRLTQASSTTFSYDDNGNMITETGGWTYTYDYDDRLTKVQANSTTKGEYFYDGDGLRIKKVTYSPSKTEVFTYIGFNILYEKNTSVRWT